MCFSFSGLVVFPKHTSYGDICNYFSIIDIILKVLILLGVYDQKYDFNEAVLVRDETRQGLVV